MKTKTIKLGEREVEIRKLSMRQLRDASERVKAIAPDAPRSEVEDEWRRIIAAAVVGGSPSFDDLLDLTVEDVILGYADVLEWSHMVKRAGEPVAP